MKQLYTKDGRCIVGTLETIKATAILVGVSEQGDPIYSGNTEVDWDSRESVNAPHGGYVWLCEDGKEHRLADLDYRDE